MRSANRVVACAVAGASGRMGRELLALIANAKDLRLVGAWVGASSAFLGQLLISASASASASDETGLRYRPLGETVARPDVVIDFSRADAFDDVLDWCRREKIALVSGTTGLAARQHAALSAAATVIPILWSANFSLGIAVLMRAITDAARLLPDWDVEIIEAHHAGKRDAPSGTALALGKAIAEARGRAMDSAAVFDRHGTDRARQAGEIGFAAVRAGDIVGEHTVVMAVGGERLELGHRASDRAIFARGALHAARWLVDRSPGLYELQDCLIGAD